MSIACWVQEVECLQQRRAGRACFQIVADMVLLCSFNYPRTVKWSVRQNTMIECVAALLSLRSWDNQ